jgi:3-hydroxypropionate dehydrogenase (NADP+)
MREITNISCIGAGLIGQGWATQFCSGGYDLILYDLNEAILDNALGNIKSNLMFLETHELLCQGETARALKQIKTTCNLAEAVENADYVQESVFDAYDAKRQIFKEMDALSPKSAILASSSSGLLMTEIQKAVAAPQRCLMAHPYLPVHLMPLVEVVGGRQTSADALEATCDLMEKVGKIPVQLHKEASGFIVNRLQAALLRAVPCYAPIWQGTELSAFSKIIQNPIGCDGRAWQPGILFQPRQQVPILKALKRWKSSEQNRCLK